ncbi:unnamed protein product, partial [Brassica napus]
MIIGILWIPTKPLRIGLMLNLIFGRRVTLSTKAMTVKQRQPVRNISLIKPNQNMFMFSLFLYLPPPPSIKTFVVSPRLCSLQSRRKKLPKPVDLSSVLDFNSISQDFNKTGADSDSPVFCIENRPGFYFIPGALSLEEQCKWIKESLTSFPQPPNRTNHNAIYGLSPKKKKKKK